MVGIRRFAIIGYCALCFGLVGTMLGVARSLLRLAPASDPMIDISVSASLGFISGAMIGSVALLIEALLRPPRARREPDDSPALLDGEDGPRPVGMWFFLVLVTVLTATTCGGVVGFVAGGLIGEMRTYQNLADAKLAKIRPVLQEPQFAGVEADVWCAGEDYLTGAAADVYLTGEVDSERTREKLEARMQRLFGEEEAKYLLLSVWVAEK